jgi:DNA-binding transcriptional regulator LsrR (DeoR family)
MARLRRSAVPTRSDDKSLRLRAAWLYHGQGLTQNEVAEHLGLGRTTIIRLLDEAQKRGEVRIWIDEDIGELVDLGLTLERHLGIDEVIVVPGPEDPNQIARCVGLALGKFLSETISDHMTIGVGWGRTLTASLESFHPSRHSGVKVMSLLGGAVETRFANPVEFAWRLAGALDAECYLFPAPLVVDSAETKRRLIEACGLSRLYNLAKSLDLAIVSVGDIGDAGGSGATSLTRHLITEREREELIALGCVGDVMCNFFDAGGHAVAHPLNDRVMSISLPTLRTAKHVVIASGGAHRAAALHAAIENFGCQTLVTDDGAGRALLALVAQDTR